MERGQFTFYRSYWEAIQSLPKKDRLAAYEAIAEYALDGTQPQISGGAATVFILVKPTLDTGRKRAEIGKNGGSKTEAKRKQNGSKTEAKAKQTVSEKEREKEKEIEKTKIREKWKMKKSLCKMTNYSVKMNYPK